MARIAFFTERLPPDQDPISRFAFDIILSLADQGHEVCVLSTYYPEQDLPPSHPRIELLRPFRKWGWTELPRVIPILLQFKPEIIHVIQPHAESVRGLTSAMNAIPGLAKIVGSPKLISTFYDLQPDTLKKSRPLLLMSDAITVSDLQQKETLEIELAKFKRKPEIFIISVPSSSPSNSSSSERKSENLERIFAEGKSFVFVPGAINSHRHLPELFRALSEALSSYPEFQVLFGGGWGAIPPLRRRDLMNEFEKRGVGGLVRITGPLSEEEERICLAHAHLVFAASLDADSIENTRLTRMALAAGAPLAVARKDSEKDAIPWRHGENAWILEDEPFSWTQDLTNALGSVEALEKIRRTLPDFARLETVDRPGNLMSRAYARLLSRS